MKIDVISGFLGAGKTTIIKRLLETSLKDEKIVLIENEFGEVSVDSEFLSESKIDIKELSQGCICCSLKGDFSKSLKEVLDTYNPERVIIEPSGVGKLSDVINAVKDAELEDCLNSLVCLVDVKKVKMYSKNFGEFFLDQIENAQTVILSRTDVAYDKVDEALEIIRKYNQKAIVITTPISILSDYDLVRAYEGVDVELLNLEEVCHEHEHHHEECCCGGHEHEHHHDGCCCGGHEHEHHHEECCCGHHEHEHHHEGCCCGGHEHEHHHEECCCGHHEHEHHHEECCCGGHEHEHHHDECCCGGHHEHEHHHEECCCGGHEHEHHHEECCCGHHEHEHHHEGCTCGHDHHGHHHADDVFVSVGIETVQKFDIDKLTDMLDDMSQGKYGLIIRAKGVILGLDNCWYQFNLTPDEVEVKKSTPAHIGMICVIGSKIDTEEIKHLFKEC